MHSPLTTQRAQIIALISIVIAASCLGNLSQTALNTMSASITVNFGIDVGVGQLVTTIYMLVLGITVPLVTFLMRRFTLKHIVLVAIGFLFAGSLLDMCAWDFWVLIGGRILQAISAGITMPMMMSVIMVSFPPGQQATVMGIAGIAMGFAPNIGPTIGGWMVDAWGWRSFFVVLVVCAVVLLIAAVFLIEPDKQDNANAKLDIPSFLLSAISLCSLLMGFTNVSNYNITHPYIWVPLAIGVVILIVFVRRQHHIAHPLIHLDIFKSRHYRMGFLSLCFLSASFMGITLILPLFIEGCWGGTALQAGIALLPGTVAALLLNPTAGYLTDKIGIRPVVICGSILLVIGAVSMAFVYEGMSYWLIIVMQAFRSSGVSLLISPLNTWSMQTLSHEIMIDGSSASTAFRQACASMGTALMVFAITLNPMLGGGALGYQIAFGISAMFAIATFLVNVLRVR